MGIQRVGSLCYEEPLVGLNGSCCSKGGFSCANKLGEGWLPANPAVVFVLLSSTVATELGNIGLA